MTTSDSQDELSHSPAPRADLQWLIDSDVDGLLDVAEKPPKVTSSDRLERAFLDRKSVV